MHTELPQAAPGPAISHWPSQRVQAQAHCHGGQGRVAVFRPFERGSAPAALGQVDFIDLVVVPPGSSIGTHRHGHNQEWYVILAGHGRMWFDGAWRPVQAGDTLVNPPGGEHGLHNDSDEPLQLLVFQLSARTEAKA